MSCWVAPVLAAEIWGVSLESVLSGIAEGRIPTQHENGFVFVDVLPDAAPPACPEPPPAHPPTYTVVTAAELHALIDDDLQPADDDPAAEALSSSPADEEEEGILENWRQVRARTASRRKPPSVVAA